VTATNTRYEAGGGTRSVCIARTAEEEQFVVRVVIVGKDIVGFLDISIEIGPEVA